MKHVLRKILAISMLACVALSMAVPGFAAQGSTGALLIEAKINDAPQKGIAYQVWKVAEADGEAWAAPFDTYKFALKWEPESEVSALAGSLAALTVRDDLKPSAEGKTNEQGLLKLENMPYGIYLISGNSTTVNGGEYRPKPALVLLQNDEIKVELKYDYIKKPTPPSGGDDNDPTVTRKVLKVWEGDKASTRPEEIEVQLLRDGRVYDTKVLSAKNEWRYTWRGLPDGHSWVITEVDVPSDYSVSVSKAGITTVITNTLDEETPPDRPPDIPDNPGEPNTPDGPGTPDNPTNPDNPGTPDTPTNTDPGEPDVPKLPQTGSSWWMVPMLAGAGVALIVIGTISQKREN